MQYLQPFGVYVPRYEYCILKDPEFLMLLYQDVYCYANKKGILFCLTNENIWHC